MGKEGKWKRNGGEGKQGGGKEKRGEEDHVEKLMFKGKDESVGTSDEGEEKGNEREIQMTKYK